MWVNCCDRVGSLMFLIRPQITHCAGVLNHGGAPRRRVWTFSHLVYPWAGGSHSLEDYARIYMSSLKEVNLRGLERICSTRWLRWQLNRLGREWENSSGSLSPCPFLVYLRCVAHLTLMLLPSRQVGETASDSGFGRGGVLHETSLQDNNSWGSIST